MGAPLETITSLEKMTEAELEAYNLLVPKLRQARIKPREELIKPDGPYNLDEVEEDEMEVLRLEKIFEEDSRKNPYWHEVIQRAELFEALLNEGIESNNWFGKEADTIVPSRYDDLKNGIDLLVEFSIGGFVKHLGLSIDITTSVGNIRKKIDKIRRDIQNGHLARLKYFASQSTGNRGVKNDIPKVVIGADFKLVRELAGLWLNLSEAKKEKIRQERELGVGNPAIDELKSRVKKLQHRLAEHRIQFQILEEIQLQLRHFIELARVQNKDTLAQKYEDALDTIDGILREKEFELTDQESGLVEKDAVFGAIKREVS